MTRMKHSEVCLFAFLITIGSSAFATCPNTMPLELLVDCVMYEGDGSIFPTSDYAHMDHYQDWLKTQSPTAVFPPYIAGSPIIK